MGPIIISLQNGHHGGSVNIELETDHESPPSNSNVIRTPPPKPGHRQLMFDNQTTRWADSMTHSFLKATNASVSFDFNLAPRADHSQIEPFKSGFLYGSSYKLD
jgi:hypothetical protein